MSYYKYLGNRFEPHEYIFTKPHKDKVNSSARRANTDSTDLFQNNT